MRAKLISELFEENSLIAILCMWLELTGELTAKEFCETKGVTLEKFYKMLEKTPIFQVEERSKGKDCTIRFLNSFENKWVKEELSRNMTKKDFTHTAISINPEMDSYSIFKQLALGYGLDIAKDTFYEARRIFKILKNCQELSQNL